MSVKRKKTVTIVAALYWGMRYGEGMIASIQKHAPADWAVVPVHFLCNVGKRLEGLKIDGVIADLHTVEDVEEAKRLQIPVIDVASSTRHGSFPLVCADEEAVGARAKKYLCDAGHTRFAFLGFEDHFYSEQRLVGFQRALEKAGLPGPEVIHTPWNQDGALSAWEEAVARIRELPRETGIFGCSDARLIYLHAFALSRGTANLFADHGLVGVDDDREMMRIHGIHFPSIPLDFDALGQTAVESMVALLGRSDNCERGPEPVYVAPCDVVTPEGYRQLTHSPDPVVEGALRLIRAEISKPFSISWLAAQLHVSQSTLERRFREHLGETPSQWIQQLRFDRAAELLRSTDLSIKEISALIGFTEQRRLSNLFQSIAGTTPSAYRLNRQVDADQNSQSA